MSKNENDSLGNRMKSYENVWRHTLIRRTPVIIRLDGRAFHTFTKCLKTLDPDIKDGITPFSGIMHETMLFTAQAVMTSMQNAVFAYTQSDEISILLRDWDRHETEQWFDGTIQKIASVSASAASVAFNFYFGDVRKPLSISDLAQFDARVFNIPFEEVTNYFIWRQQDASRNSVQMLGHFHFSQKQIHGLNNIQVKAKLIDERGINWDNIDAWQKRGACLHENFYHGMGYPKLIADKHIPVFTESRAYVERHLTPPPEANDK